MNLDNWDWYFKHDDQGRKCWAQQVYEPLISPDKKTFCMNFDHRNKYQTEYASRDLTYYTADVVEFFFQNECFFLDKFSHKAYMPEILDIKYDQQKIFFEWYSHSCDKIVNDASDRCDYNTFKKVNEVIRDQVSDGIYKITCYPHAHFVDDVGQIKAFDWYSAVTEQNYLVDPGFVYGIISQQSLQRLEKPQVFKQGKIDVKVIFEEGLKGYNSWGDISFQDLHKELFGG